MTSSNDSRFAVTCPSCRAKLKVKRSDLGSSRACPNCQNRFVLPTPQATAVAAAKLEYSFPCRLCATRIYVLPHQSGKQVECPDCQTVNSVPAPTQPKPTVAGAAKVRSSEGDDYELRPFDDAPPPPSAVTKPQFRLACPTCSTMLYFEHHQVGTLTVCPDCDSKFAVPKPRPVAKKQVIVARDPGIGMQPPAANRSDDSVALRVMERAKARVDEKTKKEELPPIKRPFSEGIWTFPFSLSALPFCIVASGVACLIAYAIIEASNMTGLMQIASVFLLIFAVFASALLALLSSVFWMTIISWTAMGHRTIKEFPRVDLFEWIRTSLFIINAGGISVAPAALLAALLPIGSLRTILAIPALFAFFPIILMSMLEDESPISLYSKTIHESLKLCTKSWLKFYAIAGVLSILVAIPHILGFFIESPAWNYLAAITLIVSTVIYFRAFGRLAWVINEKMLIEKDDEDDAPEPIDSPPLPDSVR